MNLREMYMSRAIMCFHMAEKAEKPNWKRFFMRHSWRWLFLYEGAEL